MSKRFKTPMQKLNLCDYSDAYIFVKEIIDALAASTSNYPDQLAQTLIPSLNEEGTIPK